MTWTACPWELARLPWQVLLRRDLPAQLGRAQRGPPSGMRSPSNVGACAFRRSTGGRRVFPRYRPRQTATPHLRRRSLGLLYVLSSGKINERHVMVPSTPCRAGQRAAGLGMKPWRGDRRVLIPAQPRLVHDAGRLKALGPRRALRPRRADGGRLQRRPRSARARMARRRHRPRGLGRKRTPDRARRAGNGDGLAGSWRRCGADTLRSAGRVRRDGDGLAGRGRRRRTDAGAGHACGRTGRARGTRSARCGAVGAWSADLRERECCGSEKTTCRDNGDMNLPARHVNSEVEPGCQRRYDGISSGAVQREDGGPWCNTVMARHAARSGDNAIAAENERLFSV
jgi:hypothetical protein